MELCVCPSEVGFVVANPCCNRLIHLGQLKLDPRGRACDEGDFACGLYHSFTVKDLRFLWNDLRSYSVSVMNAGGTPTSRRHMSTSWPSILSK